MSGENDPEAKSKEAARKIGKKIDPEVRGRTDSTGSGGSNMSRASSEGVVELPEQLEQLKQQVGIVNGAPPNADALFRRLRSTNRKGQSVKRPEKRGADKGPFGWRPK